MSAAASWRSPRNASRWSRPAGWPMWSARCRRRWRRRGSRSPRCCPATRRCWRRSADARRGAGAAGPVRRPGAAAARQGAPGWTCCVLDAPHLFGRPGNPYLAPDGDDWADNGHPLRRPRRRGGAMAAASRLGFDVVHAHDWQAGLAGAYLRFDRAAARAAASSPSTTWPSRGNSRRRCSPRSACRRAACRVDGRRVFRQVGFLKAGLWYRRPHHHRLPDLCRGDPHAGRRHGRWTGCCAAVPARSAASSTASTRRNGTRRRTAQLAAPLRRRRPGARAPPTRRRCRRRFGLAADPAAPLFGFVGRLAWQKGMDLVLEALPALLGGRRAARHPRHRRCGAGSRAASAPPRRIPAGSARVIGFDEALARLGLWRRRCGAGALALRALRPRPALRPALRRAAGGGPCRRAGRYGDRRERGGAGRGLRAPACSSPRRRRDAGQRDAARPSRLFRDAPGLGAHAGQCAGRRRLLAPLRRALCRAVPGDRRGR